MRCGSPNSPRPTPFVLVILGLAVGLVCSLPGTGSGQGVPRTKGQAQEKARANARQGKGSAVERPLEKVEKTEPSDEAEESDEKQPEKSDEKQAEERRPGIFGDPKRFTRLGGWGSVGGAMGQWGMARSVLIMMPPVQEELKLTDDQKKRIREWLDGMRERGEEMGRAMRREEMDPAAQEDVPIAARIFQFTRMMNQVGELLQENENGLGRILDKRQRTRLTQISLQMEGIAAVTRPDVGRAINLGPDQLELIQQYLAQSRLMQMTTWIERGVAMSRRFRPTAEDDANGRFPASGSGRAFGPGPGPGRVQGPGPQPARQPAASRNGQGADDRDKEIDRARAERTKAVQKELESMRERTDSLQDQLVRQIAKVLTRRQRASFEKLLGEPFDPSKINDMQRRPGTAPGSPPGASQSPSGKEPGLPPSRQGASR